MSLLFYVGVKTRKNEDNMEGNEGKKRHRPGPDCSCENVADHAASVFFGKIGIETLLFDNNYKERIKHLEEVNDKHNMRLRFLEVVLPYCITSCEKADDMYCYDCDRPLSCCDFKLNRMLRSCESHGERKMCDVCEMAICVQCAQNCVLLEGELQFLCSDCFADHLEDCFSCRGLQ